MKNISDLKVNWHFINSCNMKCRFCFANKQPRQNQLDYKSVLDKFPTLFSCVNLVGGEPTISPYFKDIVDYSAKLGLNTSLVTNGFYTSRTIKLDSTLEKLSMVGISVDSLQKKTNLTTGRHVHGKTLDEKVLIAFCKKLKALGVKLKINTVVSQYNKNENFTKLIETIEPDKWKILQVLPIGNVSDKEFQISTDEYFSFIEKHRYFSNIISTEDNELLTNSYIMVNQEGYFINTAPYEVLPEQKSLFEPNTNIVEEFSRMDYNLNKYHARYSK